MADIEEKTETPKRMRNRQVAPEAPERATGAQRAGNGTPDRVSALLRSYVDYRSAQLHAPRLGGHLGGPQAIMNQSVAVVLKVLEDMADWMDAGKPGAAAILSQQDLDRWMAARELGLEIPDDIARALPPVAG